MDEVVVALIRILLVLCLAGCGGLGAGGTRYLKQSAVFQQQLTTYQQQLREIPGLPPAERKARADALLARIRESHTALRGLKPTSQVANVHRELDTLYGLLEQFVETAASGSGDPSDPKLKQLSSDWAAHLRALEQELNKL